jgi:hypothetical protein
MKADGDCYMVAAGLVAWGGAPEGALLCHGTCTGHGPIAGVTFGHAWVETEDSVTGGTFVIEKANGNDVIVERDTYYAAGQCRDVRRYTAAEARAMMMQHGHFGPWHTPVEEEHE